MNGEVIINSRINGDAYLMRQIDGDPTRRDHGGSYSTNDYEELVNKPSIESVTLVGDKTFEQLGLSSITADELLEILV